LTQNTGRGFVCGLRAAGSRYCSLAIRQKNRGNVTGIRFRRSAKLKLTANVRDELCRPVNPRHPRPQTRNDQANQRQRKWFNSSLEIKREKNPAHNRQEQASKKPREVSLIRRDEKSDFSVQSNRKAYCQKDVTKWHHDTFVRSRCFSRAYQTPGQYVNRFSNCAFLPIQFGKRRSLFRGSWDRIV